MHVAQCIIFMQTMEQRERAQRFPCNNPRHPTMRRLESRLNTFRTWPPFHTERPPREIAEAGFFFIGLME